MWDICIIQESACNHEIVSKDDKRLHSHYTFYRHNVLMIVSHLTQIASLVYHIIGLLYLFLKEIMVYFRFNIICVLSAYSGLVQEGSKEQIQYVV